MAGASNFGFTICELRLEGGTGIFLQKVAKGAKVLPPLEESHQNAGRKHKYDHCEQLTIHPRQWMYTDIRWKLILRNAGVDQKALMLSREKE
jgi:hypothetical protein